jgi:hypothetical protein
MKKRVGDILRVNVGVPLWGVLMLGVVSFIGVYFYEPAYREHLKYVAAILGGATAIYSAYYVGTALRLQVAHQRQQASFEILALLNRPEFARVRNFVATEFEGHEKVSETELYEKVIGNRELDDSVTVVLGILEDASIAIQHDFVDEDYKSLECIVKRNFNALRGYIEQLRKRRNDLSYFVELGGCPRICDIFIVK